MSILSQNYTRLDRILAAAPLLENFRGRFIIIQAQGEVRIVNPQTISNLEQKVSQRYQTTSSGESRHATLERRSSSEHDDVS